MEKSPPDKQIDVVNYTCHPSSPFDKVTAKEARDAQDGDDNPNVVKKLHFLLLLNCAELFHPSLTDGWDEPGDRRNEYRNGYRNDEVDEITVPSSGFADWAPHKHVCKVDNRGPKACGVDEARAR